MAHELYIGSLVRSSSRPLPSQAGYFNARTVRELMLASTLDTTILVFVLPLDSIRVALLFWLNLLIFITLIFASVYQGTHMMHVLGQSLDVVGEAID